MKTYYLEIFLVVVIDTGKNYAHEDIQVDDDKNSKENSVPVAFIICWHPVRESIYKKQSSVKFMTNDYPNMKIKQEAFRECRHLHVCDL